MCEVISCSGQISDTRHAAGDNVNPPAFTVDCMLMWPPITNTAKSTPLRLCYSSGSLGQMLIATLYFGPRLKVAG